MVKRLAAALLFLVVSGLPRVGAQDAPPARGRPDAATALITTDPAAESSPALDSVTATETAVLATHDAMIRAIESLEFDRLSSLLVLTDRGALVADGRLTLTTGELVELIRREFAPLLAVHHTFTRRHVSILSPTTALIVAEGAITARTHDGATFTRPFAQTLVFMRIDDTWKIAHLHSSTPPATLGG